MTLDEFIEHWTGRDGGAERANYALFLTQFCAVLGLPEPQPASADTERNDYVFERFVRRPDGTNGRIDLYKRDCFVLEAKQSRQNTTTLQGGANDKYIAPAPQQLSLGIAPEPTQRGRRTAGRAWDVLMLNARQQAEDYARHLPQDHGWPPFVIVCDVGHSFELFADFRRMGKYEQFPDRQSYRIFLSDLRDPPVQERLRGIWTDPYSLDPSKRAAKTTREIARRLAEVSKALETKGARAEDVAHFLMRCIFTMFAEDWKLLPENSFLGLLERSVHDPAHFPRRVKELWAAMDKGGWSATIDAEVRRFNGGLFAETTAFELGREEIGELLAAAKADWRDVEPAIFGTLLEQALDPNERRKLGAHYTPRAYVERLVTATIIEPLRDDWRLVLGAAEERRSAGDAAGAAAVVKDFHDKLCDTRVLDPACGTGNFLYVSLELMKRLEGEVLEALADLGGQEALTGLEGHTVDPHQFLGLELNPRAAAIAELVLWIGYLQQHFKLKGAPPGDPILRAFKNINFGRPGGYDAVLTWDGYPVPKVVEGAETYPNARPPEWPEAEFIVGNPPFLGKGKDMRDALSDAYVDALSSATPTVNDSADFVMYWWDRAATLLTRKGSRLRRFGLVSTNSITQLFNRRVVSLHVEKSKPVHIIFAVPDHPWTRATQDAAAVRISMTVCSAIPQEGTVFRIRDEELQSQEEARLTFDTLNGQINPDLSAGVDITKARLLTSNRGISWNGVMLASRGFVLTEPELTLLRELSSEEAALIRPFMSGADAVQRPRQRWLIDTFGLSAEGLRSQLPRVYQLLLERVKPDREDKRDDQFREKWWLFGRNRPDLRNALGGLQRYLIVPETAKHHPFQFISASVLPEHRLVAIAVESGWICAVLSSKIHELWAIRAGGTLEDRPVYNKTLCFEKFPFPSPDPAVMDHLEQAGNELDAFRKARQAEHPNLTLTQMYNVLLGMRAGRALTTAEAKIKDEGLILILNELHDRIDRLTLQAYGWPEGLSDEEILERLVALNKERAEEERRGVVRWLRPEYQKARAGVVEARPESGKLGLAEVAAAGEAKSLFPKALIDQFGAVTAALLAASQPLDAEAIATGFRQGRRVKDKVAAILTALVRTGAAVSRDGGKTFQARRAA